MEVSYPLIISFFFFFFLLLSLRLCHFPLVFILVTVCNSSLPTSLKFFLWRKKKKKKWHLFANVFWPKARLPKFLLSEDLPPLLIILEMNMKRKNVIWLVTSSGRVNCVMCRGRVGGNSVVSLVIKFQEGRLHSSYVNREEKYLQGGHPLPTQVLAAFFPNAIWRPPLQ